MRLSIIKFDTRALHTITTGNKETRALPLGLGQKTRGDKPKRVKEASGRKIEKERERAKVNRTFPFMLLFELFLELLKIIEDGKMKPSIFKKRQMEKAQIHNDLSSILLFVSMLYICEYLRILILFYYTINPLKAICRAFESQPMFRQISDQLLHFNSLRYECKIFVSKICAKPKYLLK